MMAEVNCSQLSTKRTGWTRRLSYYLDIKKKILGKIQESEL
jgi:hypothetical protein